MKTVYILVKNTEDSEFNAIQEFLNVFGDKEVADRECGVCNESFGTPEDEIDPDDENKDIHGNTVVSYEILERIL